jgi:DNA-binding transcriptional MerR regulator
MGHEVPAGACVTSIRHLADSTGLSVKSVRTALDHLKNTNEIGIETANRFSMIFIKNWGKYQGDEPSIGKQTAHKRQTTGKQLATIEEGKKERKKENYKRKRDFDERKVTDKDFDDLFINLDEEPPALEGDKEQWN